MCYNLLEIVGEFNGSNAVDTNYNPDTLNDAC